MGATWVPLLRTQWHGKACSHVHLTRRGRRRGCHVVYESPLPEAEAISPKPIRYDYILILWSPGMCEEVEDRRLDIYPDAQTAKPEPEPESLDSDSVTQRQDAVG